MDATPPTSMAASGSSGEGVFDSTMPENDRLKRKRQPRNSACQSCSALKMKCVPSAAAGFCERCNRMGKECLAAVPKPRKRRSTNGILDEHSHGVPVSGMLDGYVSPDPPTRPTLPPPSTLAEYVVPHPAVNSRSPPSRNDAEALRARFAEALRIDSSPPAGHGLLYCINAGFIHHSFDVFRNLAANFPFVLDVRLETHPSQVIVDKPMATLAVCVVTSAANGQVQQKLSRAFRQALAAKAVVDGESNIDLLSGLLIYLAWHHQYMSKPRVHQHLYTLAGIAKEFNMHDHRFTPRGQQEAQRVLLGCYYLCHNLSKLGYNKFNPMPWNDGFRQCAANLWATAVVPSDQILQPLIELTQCLEDFNAAIDNSTAMLGTTALPLAINLHSQASLQRVQNIKSQFPAFSSHPAFATSYLLIQSRSLRTASEPDPTTIHNTIATAKSYFDDILSAPPTTLHQLPIVEWTTLLSILAFLPRLSHLDHSPSSARSDLRPETILDALIARMSSAPANDPTAPRQETLLAQLRGICEALKRKISQDRDLASPEGERRFRPVNFDAGAHSQAPRSRTGSGQAESEGAEMQAGVLEDAFWEALVQPKGAR